MDDPEKMTRPNLRSHNRSCGLILDGGGGGGAGGGQVFKMLCGKPCNDEQCPV
jgi:hypothetical protein